MGRRRRDGRAVREARGAETLESYREFMDDWDAFQDAIRRPEPTTLRANTLRIDRESLRQRLEAQGFHVVPVPHQPAFLRVVEGPRAVSDTLEHWSGLFYIQQTATGWAAPLLAPEPGETVLDLCSAPGGKTTHLAELMEGRGCVVASDVNESRIRALLGNVYRLGHTNVMTLAGDSRRFPLGATFDRVMVDVPCTAEGTLRKRGGNIPGHAPKFARQVARSQERIVRRAVELTRPGGTLLYVTCTFGPSENEAVLTRLLADAPVEVEPLELPVPHARGLAEFQGERFHPTLAGAVRLYPHHLDSGGLFLCRLKRLEGDEAGAGDMDSEVLTAEAGAEASRRTVRGWTPVPQDFPAALEARDGGSPGSKDEAGADEAAETEPSVPELLESAGRFAQDQLGVDPSALERFRWLRRGNHLWAHTLDRWPAEEMEPSRAWRVVAVGLRALDLTGKGPPRPSNDLVAALGDDITLGREELSPAEWVELLVEGERPGSEKDGLVALCHGGEVLGRGFQRDGRLRHEIPKGRLNWLRNVFHRAGPPRHRALPVEGEPRLGDDL